MLLWMLAGLTWLQLFITLAASKAAVPPLLQRLIAIASLPLLVVAVWRWLSTGVEWDDQASVLWLVGLGLETVASALVRKRTEREASGNEAHIVSVPNG